METVNRRKFLRTASVAATPLVAGCGGDSSEDVPDQTTTTTAGSSAEIEPADIGPYSNWLVSRPESSVFQVDYWPEYDTLYREYEYDYGSAKRYLKEIIERSNRASDVLSASNVSSYFRGFVKNPGTNYEYIQGSFSPSELRPKLESSWEMEQADESTQGLEVMSSDAVAVAFSADEFYWVQLRGFADSDITDLLDDVVDATRDDGESYLASHDTYELLFQNLQEGHYILFRPTDAEDYGCAAYGRQFLINQTNALPEEVLVWDEPPNESEVISLVEEKSPIIQNMETSVEEVVIDGRVSTVTLKSVHNSRLLRVTGYVN